MQPRLTKPPPGGWRVVLCSACGNDGWHRDPIRCGRCGDPPPDLAPGDERAWEDELDANAQPVGTGPQTR